MKDPWNRCDQCGRFISLDDFADGKATHKMLEPSSDLGVETWETLCSAHSNAVTVSESAPCQK
jgi:hypothetical protein